MQYNYNETNIVTGYIKELLHDFNLPIYSVYKEGKKSYNGKIYINRDKIVKYNNGVLEPITKYVYNRKVLNTTKNLIINSSVYDNYTHKYLGDYLRFLRDYKNLNLMPLYNCFLPEAPVGLNYSLNINKTSDINNGFVFKINSDDSRYNYYVVPAKFNETYTININTLAPYEVCCIIYNGDTVLDISKVISKLTYKKVQRTGRNFSFIYSTEIDDDSLESIYKNYWQYENNLRILLKLPKSIDSSITILEGNYSENNDVWGQVLVSKLYLDDNSGTVDSVGKLSLLDSKSNISHPFADRLVEYLLGGAITNLEEIPLNIARVQDDLVLNTSFENSSSSEKIEALKFKSKFYDTWDDFIRLNILRRLFAVNTKSSKKAFYDVYKYDNDSHKYIKSDFYSKVRPVDDYYDLLGYVDKDVEQNLKISTIIKEE